MKNSIRITSLIFNVLAFSNCFSQSCGTTQSLSNVQKSQINAFGIQLNTALTQEDFSAIDSLSSLLKIAHGSEVGKPEAIEVYYNLIETTNWQDLNNAILLSRQLIANDSLVYANLWKVAKGMKPPLHEPHSIFLRSAAEIAVGLLKIAHKETDQNRKAIYQSWATKALDSLATMQLPNGAFPFPDLRPFGDPVFSTILQNYLNSLGADSSLVLVNGWIIDDQNTGEFRFDAGVIGNAFYEAYTYTGNTNYKNVTISVANYLMPLKMNLNYNYNTFASLGLTRGFQLTNDTNYLNRAIINLRYGLYPWQLTNGRWVDGHNARSVYHNIIISNIIPTINLIPNANPYKTLLNTMAERAIQNQTNYTLSCGGSTGYKWLINSFVLDSNIYSTETKNQIKDLIGRHINQSAINGKYLDMQTMGLYIELLNLLSLDIEVNKPINSKNTVFPNPFDHQINIIFELPYSQNVNVLLFNSSGNMIQIIDSGQKIKGTYNYNINSLHLPTGLYFVVFQTELGNQISKILKQ